MGRCNACYNVITRKDTVCYVCGEKLPRYASLASTRKRLTLFSNVLFMASLGFTGFAFYAGDKLPLSLTIAVSCSLLALKLLADRHAKQAQERADR